MNYNRNGVEINSKDIYDIYSQIYEFRTDIKGLTYSFNTFVEHFSGVKIKGKIGNRLHRKQKRTQITTFSQISKKKPLNIN